MSSVSQKNSDNEKINVIVADTRWETFEQISCPDSNINFLNLSSNFAVNFILEYERIDVIIISRNISGLDEIKNKANKVKASVYTLGDDIKYPVDNGQVYQILKKERSSRLKVISKRKRKSIASIIKDMLGLGSEQRLKRHEKKDSEAKEDKQDGDISWLEELGQDEGEPFGNNKDNDNKLELEERPLVKDDNEIIKDFQGEDSSLNREDTDEYEKIFWDDKDRKSNKPTLSNFIAIKQKIIVFLKAKGGVGSTLLSLFIAYHFRKLKTLLVDLNFGEGGSDIGYYLSIPKSPNMIVFIEGYNRNSMDNSVVKIKENLDVLQAPPTYELSKKIELQDVYSMIDIAKKKYHLIIFDLPNQVNETYLGVLDISDLAVMVSDFTVGSIGRLISINKRFFYDDMEKLLVLNRNRNGNGLSFINDYVREFFKKDEIITVGENNLLNKRIDFKDFDFSNVTGFSDFADRILERLTCE